MNDLQTIHYIPLIICLLVKTTNDKRNFSQYFILMIVLPFCGFPLTKIVLQANIILNLPVPILIPIRPNKPECMKKRKTHKPKLEMKEWEREMVNERQTDRVRQGTRAGKERIPKLKGRRREDEQEEWENECYQNFRHKPTPIFCPTNLLIGCPEVIRTISVHKTDLHFSIKNTISYCPFCEDQFTIHQVTIIHI